jgi:hypothetical protein
VFLKGTEHTAVGYSSGYRKQEKNLYLPLMSNPCEHWAATKKLRLHQAVYPIREKKYQQETVSDSIFTEDKFIQSFRITFKGITVGMFFLCKLD